MPEISVTNSYIERKDTVIRGVPVSVQKTSKYEIPWTKDKSERPEDYFLQMVTDITYSQDGREIKITIPAASSEKENRKRQISVTIDGKAYPFSQEGIGILNMDETFDIPEMEKLIKLATKTEVVEQRACIPFHFMKTVNYQAPYKKQSDPGLVKSHGDIQKLILPYIRAISNQEDPSQNRELFLPIVMPGKPHHWVVCALIINEKNEPQIAYLDSTPKALEECAGFFNNEILPEINAALKICNYPPIQQKDVSYNVAKQFSQKGCGIAASATIEKLMNRSNKADEKALLEKHTEAHSSTALNMEEDAFRRVELALAITYHENLIDKLYVQQNDELRALDQHQPLPKGQKRVSSEELANKYSALKSQLLRELKTDARTLEKNAEEQFKPKK